MLELLLEPLLLLVLLLLVFDEPQPATINTRPSKAASAVTLTGPPLILLKTSIALLSLCAPRPLTGGSRDSRSCAVVLGHLAPFGFRRP